MRRLKVEHGPGGERCPQLVGRWFKRFPKHPPARRATTVLPEDVEVDGPTAHAEVTFARDVLLVLVRGRWLVDDLRD
jgi:hypothetical protein